MLVLSAAELKPTQLVRVLAIATTGHGSAPTGPKATTVFASLSTGGGHGAPDAPRPGQGALRMIAGTCRDLSHGVLTTSRSSPRGERRFRPREIWSGTCCGYTSRASVCRSRCGKIMLSPLGRDRSFRVGDDDRCARGHDCGFRGGATCLGDTGRRRTVAGQAPGGIRTALPGPRQAQTLPYRPFPSRRWTRRHWWQRCKDLRASRRRRLNSRDFRTSG